MKNDAQEQGDESEGGVCRVESSERQANQSEVQDRCGERPQSEAAEEDGAEVDAEREGVPFAIGAR